MQASKVSWAPSKKGKAQETSGISSLLEERFTSVHFANTTEQTIRSCGSDAGTRTSGRHNLTQSSRAGGARGQRTCSGEMSHDQAQAVPLLSG